MKPIVITLRRRGLPARRWVGLFASAADAIVHTLDWLDQAIPTDQPRGSISARPLTLGARP